jgi:co-chaperonin GroES (HSP10)
MVAQPLWGNVLIRPIPFTRKTKSGIELPENTAQTPNVLQGRIISIGEGSLAFDGSVIPMKVKAGETVAFKKFEAVEIPLNNETLYLVDQRQIVTIFYEDKKVGV